MHEFEDEQAQAKARLKAYESTTLRARLAAWEHSADRDDCHRKSPRSSRCRWIGAPRAQTRQLNEFFGTMDPEYARLKAAVLDHGDVREQPAAAAQLSGHDRRGDHQAAADLRAVARRLPDARREGAARHARIPAAAAKPPIGAGPLRPGPLAGRAG